MDLSELCFETSLFTDTNFYLRPRKEIAPTDEAPAGVLGYERGPHSMVANAVDDRGVVVASAAGHVLVHTSKPPILHVVYAWVDAPGTGRRLARAVVNQLTKGARANGHCGIWLCDDVRAMVESSGDESTGHPSRQRARPPFA